MENVKFSFLPLLHKAILGMDNVGRISRLMKRVGKESKKPFYCMVESKACASV